jgi:hypothetical protein
MEKEMLTKTEAVGVISKLAREIDINNTSIDWKGLNIDIDQTYEVMASGVIDQMFSVPEANRETVMLATVTKLLVENLALNLKQRGNDVPNPNSN